MDPPLRNLITDVPGLTVGSADDAGVKSGVTVIVCDGPAVGSGHVMGGAPGTRETDLLAPEALVEAEPTDLRPGGLEAPTPCRQGARVVASEGHLGDRSQAGRLDLVMQHTG